jgi:hypothetical protein
MSYLSQYQLALNDEFNHRVVTAMVLAATQVMAEAANTEGHAKRTDLAYRVLNDPTAHSMRFSFAVVSNPAIGAQSSDGDIAFTVNSVWNALAGVVL